MNEPSLAQIERLTGARASKVTALANHDYRSAWRAETDGGVFVVKRDTRPGFQQREYDVQVYAASIGLAVPPVMGYEVEDAGGAMAMRWMPGAQVHKTPTPAFYAEIGRALAKLHAGRGYPDVPVSAIPAAGLEGSISPWLEYLLVRERLDRSVADKVLAFAREHEPLAAAAPTSLLHGDCQSAHFLVDVATTSITAIIDWADACEGDPAQDIGLICLFYPERIDDLLDGYGGDPVERARIRAIVPFYMAHRGAAAAEWMDAHGFPGFSWPEERVVAAAALMP